MDSVPARDSVSHILAQWSEVRDDIDLVPIGVLARLLRLSGGLIQQARGWLDAEGLTWESFSLIVTLRRQGPPFAMRPAAILAESLLTSGALTARIDRVEGLGLVRRRPDPGDRRGVIVELTPEGLRKADAAISLHARELRALLGGIEPAELERLDALLSRALATVEARRAAGAGSGT